MRPVFTVVWVFRATGKMTEGVKKKNMPWFCLLCVYSISGKALRFLCVDVHPHSSSIGSVPVCVTEIIQNCILL